MPLEIKKAVRHAVPMIISLSGVSGSGKTYSALLLAAGLIGPNQKLGFLDTENGRGCMYADSPGIRAAIPQGYDTIELAPPFHPERYIEAIDAFEAAGYKALVIDSGSHAWAGEGGCVEIAERDRGRWNKAKLANKRLINRLLFSSMHIVVCLRGQEKSKIIKLPGKAEETISLGILPVCEKATPFEFLLSFFMEEKTNLASPVKCPEPLMPLFKEPRLLTKEDGTRISQWNETGELIDPADRLVKRSRSIAEQGMAKYQEFVKSLTADQRKTFPKAAHEENMKAAKEADAIPTFGTSESPVEWPDSFDGPELIWNGKRLTWNEQDGNYKAVEVAA